MATEATSSARVPQPTSAGANDAGFDQHVDRAVEVLAGRLVTVLTGAGVSTDSGIPDYRGAGALPRNPMTFQQFMSDTRYRKRYWAGSHLGWPMFSAAEPNPGHAALAEMEARGILNGIITQNVDGLHLRAGSRRVVDIHGSLDRVLCLVCGQTFARVDVAARLDDANPWLTDPEAFELAPDGDVEVKDIDSFVVPDCSVCGGYLKPDVVFFGEFIPAEKFTEASALVHSAEALLIAGSSLMVNSGIRLLDQAAKRKLPIVIVNRGTTKGDPRANIKIDAGTTETLTALAQRLQA